MEENGFLVITFDSEVQMTSGFHWCASFDEIFHRTPIIWSSESKVMTKKPFSSIFTSKNSYFTF